MQKFSKTSISDWEDLVKKQLKTEDIYSILSKDTIEGIEIKPYYDSSKTDLSLQKNTENTYFVAKYHPDLVEDHFAFLVENDVIASEPKTLFTENCNLLQSVSDNKIYSLIDPFSEFETHDIETNLQKIKSNIATQLAYTTPNSICIDVALHQNAGASRIQQLAFALAKTKELIELRDKEIIKNLVFRWAVGHHYFLEIAKLRAFKILFYNLCKEYDTQQVPFLFVESSTRSFTKTDEENNLIRSTLALSAAMIGGADALYSSNYKVSHESDLSNEISYKQQMLLGYESIINVFPDAASGSYYIEEITHQMADKAWELFLEIENNGGYLEMLSQKKIQEMVYQQAILEQEHTDLGNQKLIGINQYPKLEIKKSNADVYSEKLLKKVALSAKYED